MASLGFNYLKPPLFLPNQTHPSLHFLTKPVGPPYFFFTFAFFFFVLLSLFHSRRLPRRPPPPSTATTEKEALWLPSSSSSQTSHNRMRLRFPTVLAATSSYLPPPLRFPAFSGGLDGGRRQWTVRLSSLLFFKIFSSSNLVLLIFLLPLDT